MLVIKSFLNLLIICNFDRKKKKLINDLSYAKRSSHWILNVRHKFLRTGSVVLKPGGHYPEGASASDSKDGQSDSICWF